jgi:hypothetical protein
MVERVKLLEFSKRQSHNAENKSTRIIKDAILAAAGNVGYDGHGKDGLVGYLSRIAREHPQTMCSLLAKLLPLQAKKPEAAKREVYETYEQLDARLRERGMSLEVYRRLLAIDEEAQQARKAAPRASTD